MLKVQMKLDNITKLFSSKVSMLEIYHTSNALNTSLLLKVMFVSLLVEVLLKSHRDE